MYTYAERRKSWVTVAGASIVWKNGVTGMRGEGGGGGGEEGVSSVSLCMCMHMYLYTVMDLCLYVLYACIMHNISPNWTASLQDQQLSYQKHTYTQRIAQLQCLIFARRLCHFFF